MFYGMITLFHDYSFLPQFLPNKPRAAAALREMKVDRPDVYNKLIGAVLG